MKIDLHLHTKHSRRPAVWLLQKLGCPESFTDPVACYNSLKKLGMQAVTFTDHNSIDGCLEIAHLADTFISEEITSYFPEDRCKVHVLAYDITKEQHEVIQACRENLYELVKYLRSENIFHAIAHPFSAVNDYFSQKHFEKLLLLFKVFELNGDNERSINNALRHILETLTPEEIHRLSDKHEIIPDFDMPHVKRFVSGSDDHSGINYGKSYTRVAGVNNISEFFDGVYYGESTVTVHDATARAFARNIYSVAYSYIKDRFNLHKYSGADVMLRFADAILEPNRQKNYGLFSKIGFAFESRRTPKENKEDSSLTGYIRLEASKLIRESERFMQMTSGSDSGSIDENDMWYEFVNSVSKRTLDYLARSFFQRLSGGHFFDLFNVLGSTGSLYMILAPYFVAYPFYASERRLCRRITNGLRPGKMSDRVRLAHFTDTFHETNGVALTIRRNLECALKSEKYMRVITSDLGHEKIKGVKCFEPVCSKDLPEYPEMNLDFLPFLEVLDYCYDRNFNYIHAATPGPIGLTALAIARILGTPVCSTYHTAVADYVDALTEDKSLSDLTWKFMVWFYNQMDMVLVSSKYSYYELKDKGVNPDKIKVFPRGVNVELFSPDNFSQDFLESHDLAGKTVMLYSGRVSKEKGLAMIPEVVRQISEMREDVVMLVCGDGPYIQQLKRDCKDLPVVFTGMLSQDKIAQAYASSDFLVFPSSTDTFGNVVVEAQASGLPVIVSDLGGPCENIIENETGFIFQSASAESLIEKIKLMLALTSNERSRMKEKAFAYARNRTYSAAFEQTWSMYDVSGKDKDSDAEFAEQIASISNVDSIFGNKSVVDKSSAVFV